MSRKEEAALHARACGNRKSSFGQTGASETMRRASSIYQEIGRGWKSVFRI
jgi:hypothetical protein